MGDQHTDDVKPYEVDNNVDKKMSWEKTLHNIVYGIVTTDIDAIRHTLEKHFSRFHCRLKPYHQDRWHATSVLVHNFCTYNF
ncbi:hypothetical protein SeLEV6574_g08589 [Synchytrium endobioticum]|uniref:Uncharacterized protein n=1 Tax=Synchytrium endobioticum TaxID=286115 RepID=A0A507BYG1_9FUNG|nr:hypothetical protein SeLEV6574_g08589 [Synchytrium endobioticum]